MKKTISYFFIVAISASFFLACNSGDTMNDDYNNDSSFFENNNARPDSFREDTTVSPVDTMPYTSTH